MSDPIASHHSAAETATGNPNDCHLFSVEKLHKLSNWTDICQQLESRNLQARPLELGDFDRGYLQLLSQLTEVGQVSRADFEARFNQMKDINRVQDHYAIVVIEDIGTNRVVGASTLFLEYKFIHGCAMRARLEDVAVLDTYRGKQIGELVVGIIVELARQVYGCYKITLDCKDELKGFYSKNKFVYGSNMLTIRF